MNGGKVVDSIRIVVGKHLDSKVQRSGIRVKALRYGRALGN